MSYFTLGSGLETGPKGKIGSGAEYHIDFNFSGLYNQGKFDEIVKILDNIDEYAGSKGLAVEFSAPALYAMRGDPKSPIRWDKNADPATKLQLAKDVMQAHGAHSTNKAMDFYLLPKAEHSRFTTNDVKHEIPIVLKEGWKVVYGKQEGGYGNFGVVYDSSGELIYKLGHGNMDKPLPKDFVATKEYAKKYTVTEVSNPQTPNPTEDMARQYAENIPQEEVNTQVEQEGAERTYNSLKGAIPSLFSGLSGIILPILFIAVLMGAGEKATENDRELNEEQRIQKLRNIDKEREQQKIESSKETKTSTDASNSNLLKNDNPQFEEILQKSDVSLGFIESVQLTDMSENPALLNIAKNKEKNIQIR